MKLFIQWVFTMHIRQIRQTKGQLESEEGYVMEIYTARCTICQFEERDIDDFMVYRNNMDWMRYQGFKGLTRQEYMAVLLGDNSIQNGLQLAIRQNASNSLIGDLYLKQEGDVCWIGFSICPANARKGYAHEATTAAIALLKEKGFKCIKADVEKDNVASITLLKKLGFLYEGTKNGAQIFALHL